MTSVTNANTGITLPHPTLSEIVWGKFKKVRGSKENLTNLKYLL